MKTFLSRIGTTKIILLGAALLVGGWVLYAYAFKSNAPASSQFVSVSRSSIVETVAVTGNTTPVTSVSLSFQNGGRIVAVNNDVGAYVNPGDVIARVDASDLQAQLSQAQAGVDAATAQLKSLQAGTRPEDIATAQANLQGAQQSLANMYVNAPAVLADGFAKANDAVRNQLAPLFTNAETQAPQLSFFINDSQVLNNIQFQRIQAGAELNAWQADIIGISPNSPTATLEAVLQKGASHLSVIANFLVTAGQTLIVPSNLSSATLASYKNALASALSETNTATTEVNNSTQSIASQKITVSGLLATYNKAVAGPRPEDIAAQQAAVEQQQANAESIQVKINQASLVSPVAGVITVQNAKVGQIASPGVALISVISNNALEIDAQVPETDIGKVAVGDSVGITFDAFPGETFQGKLFYVDPAETIVQGVVDYKIKVSFNKADPRIKSGLTANLSIRTQEKDNVLLLPQYAVLQTDKGSFVKIYKNGQTTQVPVTLGIHDDKGNVEITSGVNEGDRVMNVGLK